MDSQHAHSLASLKTSFRKLNVNILTGYKHQSGLRHINLPYDYICLCWKELNCLYKVDKIMYFSEPDTSHIQNLWPHTCLEVEKLRVEEDMNHSVIVTFYGKHLNAVNDHLQI